MLKRSKFFVICFLLLLTGCSVNNSLPELEVAFNGGYGQIEVGGRYAGVEFHKSRPIPSRISFYYPVANSIDLSTDYWKRYESLPMNFLLKSGNQADSLGKVPYEYSYTPYKVNFKNSESGLSLEFSYNFCEDFPLLVLSIRIKNVSDRFKEFELQSYLNTTIRSSHSYSIINPHKIQYSADNSLARASYADISADSSVLFMINSGYKTSADTVAGRDNNIGFTYSKQLAVNEELEIIQLIGMCRIDEQETIIDRARLEWRSSLKYEQRILNYVFKQAYFDVKDADIMQTVHWSKAIIAANNHYLDGKYVPMPCPAEYNFFFTHDLLLTGLGAVFYDPDFVRKGFKYLKSLTASDSILVHARYWKDDHFQNEYCNSDNWNHLWFIILASSYLKHSADLQTIREIFPVLKKSLQLMLQNKGADNLMYAKRPDWWDIGNIYGARAYISILMYKVLQDYVYIAGKLNMDQNELAGYLEISREIKTALVNKLWDQDKGYLMNMMSDTSMDSHYYAGSLLAAHYNLLDSDKTGQLLQTTKKQLLDENIGVRNAMPNDFHELISEYKFNGLEVGLPYVYFNGGVWPHNIIWYVLALNSSKRTQEALHVIKKYMTINGIMNSPNGIPSFFEYRMTDPASDRYGEIDKPTFLWAGGFFLQAIYQIAGMHENSYNIYFRADTPAEFIDAQYDLSLYGKICRVKWQGEGKFFEKILVDSSQKNSAVITAAANNIVLIRGIPDKPYLAEANFNVKNVHFDIKNKTLQIDFSGYKDQSIHSTVVSPIELEQMTINNISGQQDIEENITDGIYVYTIKTVLPESQGEFHLEFN